MHARHIYTHKTRALPGSSHFEASEHHGLQATLDIQTSPPRSPGLLDATYLAITLSRSSASLSRSSASCSRPRTCQGVWGFRASVACISWGFRAKRNCRRFDPLQCVRGFGHCRLVKTLRFEHVGKRDPAPTVNPGSSGTKCCQNPDNACHHARGVAPSNPTFPARSEKALSWLRGLG